MSAGRLADFLDVKGAAPGQLQLVRPQTQGRRRVHWGDVALVLMVSSASAPSSSVALRVTKGRSAWPAQRWMNWASSDLPVPGSPTMSTEEGKLERVPARSTICLRAGSVVTRSTSRAQESPRPSEAGLGALRRVGGRDGQRRWEAAGRRDPLGPAGLPGHWCAGRLAASDGGLGLGLRCGHGPGRRDGSDGGLHCRARRSPRASLALLQGLEDRGPQLRRRHRILQDRHRSQPQGPPSPARDAPGGTSGRPGSRGASAGRRTAVPEPPCRRDRRWPGQD